MAVRGAKAMSCRIRCADFPVVAVAPPTRVVVAASLPDGYDAIAFNAGRLDASIVPSTRDDLRIAEPRLVPIRE